MTRLGLKKGGGKTIVLYSDHTHKGELHVDVYNSHCYDTKVYFIQFPHVLQCERLSGIFLDLSQHVQKMSTEGYCPLFGGCPLLGGFSEKVK